MVEFEILYWMNAQKNHNKRGWREGMGKKVNLPTVLFALMECRCRTKNYRETTVRKHAFPEPKVKYLAQNWSKTT